MPHAEGDGGWQWFAAWLFVGAVSTFAFFVAGIGALAVAVVAIALLARHRSSRTGLAGLLAGLGVPLLYVALTNRRGPGTFCTTTPTSVSCGEQSDPRPWLAFGVLLIVLGVGEFWWQRASAHRPANQRSMT